MRVMLARDQTGRLTGARPITGVSEQHRRRERLGAGAHNSLTCREKLVGLPGLEPGTSSLSEKRSNRLSYRP